MALAATDTERVQSRTGKAKRDLEREHAARTELAERIVRHVAEDGRVEAAPGLFLFRYSAPTGPLYGVSEPSFCVVVQGSKEVLLGDERYRYDASRYLLVSAEVPAVGHIIEASQERPYLAVRLVLEPAVVTAVLTEASLLAARSYAPVKAVAVSRLDADLLDSVLRIVRLIDAPRDYCVLAPLAAREIVYRLASGEQGGRLRQIAVVDGHAPRIAGAIERLRKDFDKPLRITSLARQLGMSVSGFHHNFKAVTAMSPLQFQKQLRLQEARRLLLAGDANAASAGYRVGYDDPSHFSREYKRHFGQPPMRDVERLRSAAASPSAGTASARSSQAAAGPTGERGTPPVRHITRARQDRDSDQTSRPPVATASPVRRGRSPPYPP